jgi:iron(III) transport system ATP-binding protein
VIEVKGLAKQYETSTGRVAAMCGVDLQLKKGERFGLFGPSGCGKTTLLRCLAGLEVPNRGYIAIDGITVFEGQGGVNEPPWKRPIGFVFQDYALWPHMTALENVLFPLRHGRSMGFALAEQEDMARDALHTVRLDGLEGRFPFELSGGQRQRLAPRPSLLLLDEPLSSLDSHLRKQTRTELIGILEEAGITTIFVSHDHFDGLFMAHRLGVMRDGMMVQVGSSLEIFSHPVDIVVAEALNIGTAIPCRKAIAYRGCGTGYVVATSGETLVLSGENSHIHDTGKCSLLFRGDACRIWTETISANGAQKLAGIVVQQSYSGRGWCVLVRIAEVLLEVWEEEQSNVVPGQSVYIAVDATRVQLIAGG